MEHDDCPLVHRKLIDTGRVLLAFSHYSKDLITQSVWQRTIRRYSSKKTSNRRPLICIYNILRGPLHSLVHTHANLQIRIHPSLHGACTCIDTCTLYTCMHIHMLVHAPHLLYFHLVYPHQLFFFFLLSVELCILVFLHVCVWRCGEVEDCQCEFNVISAVKSAKQSGGGKRPWWGQCLTNANVGLSRPRKPLKMRNAPTISRLRR